MGIKSKGKIEWVAISPLFELGVRHVAPSIALDWHQGLRALAYDELARLIEFRKSKGFTREDAPELFVTIDTLVVQTREGVNAERAYVTQALGSVVIGLRAKSDPSYAPTEIIDELERLGLLMQALLAAIRVQRPEDPLPLAPGSSLSQPEGPTIGRSEP